MTHRLSAASYVPIATQCIYRRVVTACMKGNRSPSRPIATSAHRLAAPAAGRHVPWQQQRQQHSFLDTQQLGCRIITRNHMRRQKQQLRRQRTIAQAAALPDGLAVLQAPPARDFCAAAVAVVGATLLIKFFDTLERLGLIDQARGPGKAVLLTPNDATVASITCACLPPPARQAEAQSQAGAHACGSRLPAVLAAVQRCSLRAAGGHACACAQRAAPAAGTWPRRAGAGR